ncbi:MAG: hypothetical protein ACK5JF_11270 [Oscillospiraceae bacterium]
MRKSNIFRVLAAALVLTLALTGCSLTDIFNKGGGSRYQVEPTPDNRRTISYDDMEYVRPDAEAIKARVEELAALAANAKDFDELLTYDDEVSALMEEFYSMSTLAELRSYHDRTDTYYEEENRYCEEVGVTLSNAVNDFNRVIVEGAYADKYREEVGDYVFESIENALTLNSKEVEALKQERNALNIDYNSDLTNLTLQYEGSEYTMEDIENFYYEENDIQKYYTYLMLYYKVNAEKFTEYYKRMVEIDKEVASILGFASAADMYYLRYSRDYTPADAEKFFDYTKELFVPLIPSTNSYSMQTGSTVTLEDAKAAMPDALKTINPELAEAWQFMMDNNLYDYEALPDKQSGIAFATTIDMYDAPFNYVYWEDNMYSTTSMMHEFGHYYDFWLHYDDSIVFNLDVAEIYSQGLELLMQENFSDFTNDAEYYQAAHLADFINPLTYQPLLEEFQMRVFEMDEFDVDSISELYADLQIEYGYGDYALIDENGRDYTWFRVTHIFDSPFYTISYWTSAVAALEIWAIGEEKWEDGVDKYLELIHADQNKPFRELLASVDLPDPTKKETLENIADLFDKQLSSAGSGSRAA